MKTLPILKPGDLVELIAPASRCTDKQLQELKTLLESWQLNCIVKEDIFAEDLLCANTDEERFRHLNDALQHPETKAIICARGGYGSMRLIPKLIKTKPPASPKIFVGMSDTTSLQLFIQQQWGWPTIHGAAAPDRYSAESIRALKAILFAEINTVDFVNLKPLNEKAKENKMLESTITGGNLTLVQASVGTNWQMDGRNKFILLEEVSERGYRLDRMLEHLQQAHMFKDAKAILLGDFLNGNEPDGTSLIQPVLERFAESLDIPVVQIEGIGHGYTNFPVLFETHARLQLGDKIQLMCTR